MSITRKLTSDELKLGILLRDPLLFPSFFWKADLTIPHNRMDLPEEWRGKQLLSKEQKLMFCDVSRKVLFCTARKIAKTLLIERDVVQLGLMNDRRDGGLDEAMFFTPGDAHMSPVRSRIFSKMLGVPLFKLFLDKKPSAGEGGAGTLQFKTGLKWHFRIEGICLAGDTEVVDADTGAVYTLADIYHLCCPNSIHTLSDKGILKTNNFAVNFSGRQPLYLLTLADGSEIKATGEHKFLTQDGWRELQCLSTSDFVAVPGVLPTSNTQSAISHHEARLLGYFVGDGGTTHGTPRFASVDSAILDDVGSCCRAIGVELKPALGAPYNYVASNGNAGGKWAPNPLTEFLRRHSVWGKYSYEKVVPLAVFCSDNETVAQFIGALWSCDGSVFKSPNESYYLEFTSTSKELVFGMATLLLRFGIRGRIDRRAITGNETTMASGHVIKNRHDAWRWRSGSIQDVQKFCRAIKYFGKKRVDPNTIVSSKRSCAFKSSSIPAPLVWQAIQRKWHGSQNELARQAGVQYILKNHTYKTYAIQKAMKINSVLADEELQLSIDGVVRWIKVKSVKPCGEGDTYDLLVDDTHNFIANRIIVHNSGSDANMAGIRAKYILGDELAFGSYICHNSRGQTALPDARWKYCGVPNGIRDTPFYALDQTSLGASWSRHKYTSSANPLYKSEKAWKEVIDFYGGVNTQGFITQCLGEWGSEMFSSFPPGSIAVKELPFTYLELTNKEIRQDVLDDPYLARLIGLPTGVGQGGIYQAILGWDYGFSPDPCVMTIFYRTGSDSQDWYELMRLRMMRIPRPRQARIVEFINDRLLGNKLVGIVSDDSGCVQIMQTDLKFGPKFKDRMAWANTSGTVTRLDELGQPMIDESGKPINVRRKEWSNEEFRSAMQYALLRIPNPFYVWLAEGDETLIAELAGTIERRKASGYIEYMAPNRTPGSTSQEDHASDACRFAAMAIQNAMAPKQEEDTSWQAYAEVLGWTDKNVVAIPGWQVPWPT